MERNKLIDRQAGTMHGYALACGTQHSYPRVCDTKSADAQQK